MTATFLDIVVMGCLLKHEYRFLSSSLIPARFAYVGLSVARTEGSWQIESKVSPP